MMKHITLRAAVSATKRVLQFWLITGILAFAYLAVDTNGFSKQPTWYDWRSIGTELQDHGGIITKSPSAVTEQ